MERRSENRFTIEEAVSVTILTPPRETIPATVKDVSGHGLRLLTERALPLSTPLKLEFKDTLVLAEAVYSRPDGANFLAGIRIDQVLSDLSQLEDLNRKLMDLQSAGVATPQHQT